MPITTVSILTASAAVAASQPVAINWRCGKPVMWQVTVSTSVAIGDFTVQYSLDDLQSVPYSTVYPLTGVVSAPLSSVGYWTAVSSTPYTTLSSTGSIALHFNSSNLFPDGVVGTFLAPPAAIRLYSTGTSSHAVTLRVIQADAS